MQKRLLLLVVASQPGSGSRMPATVSLRSLFVPISHSVCTGSRQHSPSTAPTAMGTRLAGSCRVRCRTSASAVYSPTGRRLALCSRSPKPIMLQKKQLEVTQWWRHANATRCLDTSWSLQPCGCLPGVGSLFGADLRYNGAVSQPTEGTATRAFLSLCLLAMQSPPARVNGNPCHQNRRPPSHQQSSLDCFGTFRRGERLQSFNEVNENLTAKSKGGQRNPNAAVAANPGLRLLGVRIREVLEELVYDPGFHAAPLGPGLPVQAVVSARARLLAIFNVAGVKLVEGYFPEPLAQRARLRVVNWDELSVSRI